MVIVNVCTIIANSQIVRLFSSARTRVKMLDWVSRSPKSLILLKYFRYLLSKWTVLVFLRSRVRRQKVSKTIFFSVSFTASIRQSLPVSIIKRSSGLDIPLHNQQIPAAALHIRPELHAITSSTNKQSSGATSTALKNLHPARRELQLQWKTVLLNYKVP